MPKNNNIQFRRGTYSQWDVQNTGILGGGEPGYISDFNKLKVGDGVTQWSDLSAINDNLTTMVINKTASTIPKMSVVYINGAQGDLPSITLSIASGEITSSKTYGITTNSIAVDAVGQVVVDGALKNLNTLTQFSGVSAGTTLWLSPTVSGGITTVKPSAPDHMVGVGTLIRVHQTQGVINVKIQNGFELEELHNVAISGVTNGQFLQYNSSSGLWVPSSSGNFSTLRVNNTGVSLSGHTHSSSDITNFDSSVSGLLTPYQLALTNPVTGTGTINRIAYWNTSSGITSTITATGALYWDPVNIRMGIGTIDPSGEAPGGVGSPGPGLQVSGLIRSNRLFIDGTDLVAGQQNPSLNLRGYAWFGKKDGSLGIGIAHNTSGTFSSTEEFYTFTGLNAPVTLYKPLCFTAGNFPQVYMNRNGNVGINTSNPAYRLDVNGTANIVTSLRINAATANTIASFNASNNIVSLATTTYPSLTELSYVKGVTSALQTQLNSRVTGSGVASHIAYWNSSSGIIADSGQLYWDSTNDRLGIRTNSPSYTLDVSGDIATTGSLIVGSGTAAAPSFEFINDADTGLFNAIPNALAFATSGVERMRISPNGGVSINRTSPFNIPGGISGIDIASLTVNGAILCQSNSNSAGYSIFISGIPRTWNSNANDWTDGMGGTFGWYDYNNDYKELTFINGLLVSQQGFSS